MSELLKAEARDIAKRYYPNVKALKEYFVLVSTKRGHQATEELKALTRTEWANVKEARK